jgi:hypothetical protein
VTHLFINRFAACFATVVAVWLTLTTRGAEALGSAPPAQAKVVSEWEYITYPPLSLDGTTNFDLLLGFGEKSAGMRLDVRFFGGDQIPSVLEKGNFSSHLHRANGDIVGPKESLPAGQVNGQWVLIQFFPWGTNTFEEGWIEIQFGKQRYWLEIPYGFTRNPRDPLPQPRNGDRPACAPAIRATDRILHWRTVHYDLGEIQNSWRLFLVQSNPFNGQSEVILYREDTQVGKSMYLWDLHSPATKVQVIDRSGNVIQSRCMSLRIHDDGMRRSDTFNIFQYRNSEWSWGAIEVDVDGKTYRVVVPSSLYKYTQGHAEDLPGQRVAW